MEYKITLKNQLKPLKYLICITLMLPIGIYYVFMKDGYTNGIPIIFGIGYLINLIPTLFLHIEYYLKNKNNVFIIDKIEKTISINGQSAIHFNQIEKITYFMPPIWHRKGFIKFLAFEDYHYAEITIKDSNTFVFTSLMACNVQNALVQISGVKIEKRKVVFASMVL